MTKIEAREAALGALYAADSRDSSEIDTSGLGRRAAALALAVWEAREDLDQILTRHTTGWRVERMPLVDRNVLRLGTYELIKTDTPVGVVISEAVELAKRFSTERSGRFVNGVLGKIASDERASG